MPKLKHKAKKCGIKKAKVLPDSEAEHIVVDHITIALRPNRNKHEPFPPVGGSATAPVIIATDSDSDITEEWQTS